MSEVNPYAPPVVGQKRSGAVDGETEFPEGEYGGIGRAAYFGYSFLIGIIQNILTFALVAAAGPEAGLAIMLLIVAMSLAASIYVVVLRMRNMGYSGWWAAAMFVPLLNFLVGLRCLCCPEGYADHKTLDRAGKTLIWIIVGFFVLAILIVVLGAGA